MSARLSLSRSSIRFRPSGESTVLRALALHCVLFFGGGRILFSQTIVSGTMPLIPTESRHALLGFSSGDSTDDIRFESATFGCFWPVSRDVAGRYMVLGIGIGMTAQKISPDKINIGDLFGYETTCSGTISKDLDLGDGYTARPFFNASLTIGYISNNKALAESGGDGGTFPIDALDYYCGSWVGIAMITPSEWTIAADAALSRNFQGTFTDRSGSINHTLVRFQILTPLRIPDFPTRLSFGCTYGKREDITQKEFFVGALFLF